MTGFINMNSTTKTDIFSIAEARIRDKFRGATVIIPHVCNNVGVFGAGFAASVKNNYPIVSSNFELLGNNLKLGYVQYVSVRKDAVYNHEIIFANMIAQKGFLGRNNPRPLSYEALVKCMIDVRNFITKCDKDNIEIHCPKFGSGLAGGNWLFIKELISDIWHSQNVFVYSPPNKTK
jgi:hypothetical protein